MEYLRTISQLEVALANADPRARLPIDTLGEILCRIHGHELRSTSYGGNTGSSFVFTRDAEGKDTCLFSGLRDTAPDENLEEASRLALKIFPNCQTHLIFSPTIAHVWFFREGDDVACCAARGPTPEYAILLALLGWRRIVSK